jgi:hypothetical protein
MRCPAGITGAALGAGALAAADAPDAGGEDLHDTKPKHAARAATAAGTTFEIQGYFILMGYFIFLTLIMKN